MSSYVTTGLLMHYDLNKQAVRVATQYAPPRAAPPAAAHLQSIACTPYACGAQRALLHEYS